MHIRLLHNPDRRTIENEMHEIEASARGVEIMAPKAGHEVIRVYGLRYVAANILKQTMLSCGGDAAISYQCCVGGKEESDALVFGSREQIRGACRRLSEQAFGLPRLAEEVKALLDRIDTFPAPLRSKRGDFEWGKRTYIMGIVNITPDSFSGDGLALAGDPARSAVLQAKRFLDEGADIIDIGGESTRPGHEAVDADEEIRRVVPVIRALRSEIASPISVDTWKARVAEAALASGADWINDIWGLQGDPDMARVAAAHDAPVVVMHNQTGTGYRSLMGDILEFLQKSMEMVMQAGLPAEKVIVDPGIGFGKDYPQNLEVLARLGDLKTLGRPILVGTSRKSVIGRTLGLPEDQRAEGTAASVALAISAGADIVRVHDVGAMTRVVRMADAIVRRDTGTSE